MPDWRTSESAPRSGESILTTMAGGFDGPYWIVYWNDKFWESAESGNEISPPHWTHWMWLLPPPHS